jgi:hypothetical protein
MPDVSIEEDGEVGLDWDEESNRVLSLSAADDGRIGYAGLIGKKELHGRTPAQVGALPQEVVQALLSMYPSQTETGRSG